MIAGRLKVARAASGMSLRVLEEKIGRVVTAQAIGKYERGEAMPGSKALIALARALDVSEDYLLADEDLVLEGVEFRKKKIAARKAEARVKAKLLRDLERYLVVEELLGLPSVNWDRPRQAPYPVAIDVLEADRAARNLRSAWRLGTDPIPNLVELLEERGIKVLMIDVDDIDGLIARVSRRGCPATPVVVVNPSHTGERQRFTIAHELGHLVLDVSPKLKEEDAAYRFAGAFLMPAEVLWSEIGKRRSSISIGELVDLKVLFGASVQAVTHRCKDLGIIGPTLYSNLFKEFSDRGWRHPPYEEPEPLPAEKSTRFERLCFRALAEDVISESRTAELLGTSVRELDRRMELPATSSGQMA
ncbi:MAG: ImmA/IrrE family metallo-endopeptidase [Gemmatimonadetes bacterium]|nr:ImmA/IrrE family metallo-endopeptidase [Gemmatimonadota bacterium]